MALVVADPTAWFFELLVGLFEGLLATILPKLGAFGELVVVAIPKLLLLGEALAVPFIGAALCLDPCGDCLLVFGDGLPPCFGDVFVAGDGLAWDCFLCLGDRLLFFSLIDEFPELLLGELTDWTGIGVVLSSSWSP